MQAFTFVIAIMCLFYCAAMLSAGIVSLIDPRRVPAILVKRAAKVKRGGFFNYVFPHMTSMLVVLTISQVVDTVLGIDRHLLYQLGFWAVLVICEALSIALILRERNAFKNDPDW